MCTLRDTFSGRFGGGSRAYFCLSFLSTSSSSSSLSLYLSRSNRNKSMQIRARITFDPGKIEVVEFHGEIYTFLRRALEQFGSTFTTSASKWSGTRSAPPISRFSPRRDFIIGSKARSLLLALAPFPLRRAETPTTLGTIAKRVRFLSYFDRILPINV